MYPLESVFQAQMCEDIDIDVRSTTREPHCVYIMGHCNRVNTLALATIKLCLPMDLLRQDQL
jgi:hypothetical protein